MLPKKIKKTGIPCTDHLKNPLIMNGEGKFFVMDKELLELWNSLPLRFNSAQVMVEGQNPAIEKGLELLNQHQLIE
ncbi:MAG: hypothetical protein HN509_05895 [Halobacteriovoraceae bacterium]|nr:hypothetical protein [Halobacteriovoraceae bacterium]